MIYILYALTIAAFIFVLLTLVLGAKAMGGRDEAAREKSNIWMRRRVTGQAVAIGLLFLTVYVQTRGG
jgi:hypothetical protein